MKVTFISAGAGSGKTSKLVELVAGALAAGTRPERIIATTFTVKAAAEIKERVAARFLAEGKLEAHRAASALVIGTVNGVCGSLLGRFAFEAGLSPRLRVVEPEEAAGILKVVLERSLDDADRRRLFEIEERFGRDRDQKDAWLKLVQDIVAQARANGIAAPSLAAMAKESGDSLVACLDPPVKDPTADLARAIDLAMPDMEQAQLEKHQVGSAKYVEACAKLRAALAAGRWRWDDWVKLSRKDFGENVKAYAEPVRQTAELYAAHPRLHEDLREYARLCFAAAAACLEGFAAAKREAGLVDFVDQESLLDRALDRPALRERLAEGLDLLIVDEFQDTSPIQLSVFLKLAALAKRSYWVGDVKQAIYGFRGSDARLMTSVLEALPGLGGDREILDASWRSRPTLVALANALFVPAFSGLLEEEAVKLQARRPESGQETAFEHWLLAGKQAEQEAALARAVKELLESGRPVQDARTGRLRPLEPRDIGILARSNDAVARISARLAEAGLPVKGGGLSLLTRPECALLRACLRRLLDRRDSLASAELLALAEGQSPEAWLPERLAHLAAAGSDPGLWRCEGPEASPLLAALEGLRPLALRLSPAELAAAIVGRCGLDRIVASWAKDEEEALGRLAVLDSLLVAIESWEREDEAAGRGSLARLVLRLGDPDLELETPDAREGVAVLTWHGAKGLEWPVCVCHDTTKPIKERGWDLSVAGRARLEIAAPLAGRALRLWPKPFGALKSADGLRPERDARYLELEREAKEEELRLLYVAFTRARDLLVQTRPVSGKKAESPGLLEVLGPGGLELLEPRGGGEKELLLPDGTRVPYARRDFAASDEDSEAPPADGAAAADAANAPGAVPTHAGSGGLRWPRPAKAAGPFLPARLAPSEAATVAAPPAAAARALAPGAAAFADERYHEGRVLRAAKSSRSLGEAYHALLAWACADRGALERPGALEAFLDRSGAADFDPARLRDSLRAFLSWTAARWPGAPLSAEVPVSARLESGQRVEGRVDLLVETPAGLVLVDHKLVGEAREEGDKEESWVAQLESYATAIEAATGAPLLEAWINEPERGLMRRAASSKPGP